MGDGGALLNALEQLAEEDSGRYIEQGWWLPQYHAVELQKSSTSSYHRIAKVLVIQAGGYSQRFPSASVVGKAFVSFPIG